MKKLMILTAAFVAASAYAGWGDFGKAAAKEATAATIRGVAGALSTDKKSEDASSKKERPKPERNACTDAEKEERDKQMAKAKKEEKKTASVVSDASASATSLESVAKIEEDAQFFIAFKDVAKSNDQVSLSKAGVFERACKMKDEDILVDFLALYPEWNARAADIHSDWSNPELLVKSSKLAEHMLDNCNRSYKGYHARLCGVLFFATRVLDATVREKYIKRANDNLAAAKNDEELLVVDRYYVGMPVIDYVMRAFEEKCVWTKDYDAFSDYLRPWIEDGFASYEDWKDWKMETLHFTSKERAKTFKIKGTMAGFVEFLKKYVDKTASTQDITIENGWWIYLDDPHELKMELNEKNGILNIYRQR